MERILYGVAKAITEHISIGEGYGKIKKVYSISILISILVSGQTISITAKIISSVYIRVTICVSTRVNVM